MSSRTSFWELLRSVSIEIPLYQRDYVQGREDEKAKAIRIEFVKAIFNSLMTDDCPLDLGLIFGNTGVSFSPVDGQQRLTTLFLVHWYVALRAEELSKTKETFKRFLYQTRKSSSAFFQLLAELHPICDSTKMRELICDDCRYFDSYEFDPTIRSALAVIDEIERFCDVRQVSVNDFKSWWERLIAHDKRPATFALAYTETDGMYLKMNGRGKRLTDFENFKAWFCGNLAKLNIEKREEQNTKLDTKWLDVFWKYKDKDKDDDLVDQEYMRFFNGMAQLALANGCSGKTGEELHKEISLFVQLAGKEPSIPLSKYEDLKCFEDANWITWIFDVLTLVEDDGLERLKESVGNMSLFIDEKSVFEAFVTGHITYSDRVYFYATYKYLSFWKKMDTTDGRAFKRWLRVMRNLIWNTSIDRPELFIKAIKSIDKILAQLSEPGACILTFLNKNDSETDFFDGKQCEEERFKAILILSDPPTWEEIINIAEQHTLFRGRIRFLFCKLRGEEIRLEIFKHRWETADKLFVVDENGSRCNDDDFLLIRAVLSKCNSITLGWQERLFFDNSRATWKSLLDNESIVRGLISLIDNRLADNKILRGCCDANDGTSWMAPIIKYGGVLLSRHSTYKKVQNYYNNGIFLFEKLNSCEGDIWLDEEGRWRDAVISDLLKHDWKLDYEWRRVAIQSDAIMFFKGYFPSLENKAINLQLCFRYKRWTLKKLVMEKWEDTGKAGDITEGMSENIRASISELTKCARL